MEVREQDYIQHLNRFAILEKSNDIEDINSANKVLSWYEREKHKPRFDEERSKF
jgi:hypothetical protein